MKAIGIIKTIDIDGLEECILKRDKLEEKLKKEKELFATLYEQRVFPEKIKVSYDYGGGTYLDSYGGYKHKNEARRIFEKFFELWDMDHTDRNGELENRYALREFETLKKHYEYSCRYGQPIHYVYESDFGYYVEIVNVKTLIPKEYVTVQPFVDYSDIPLNRIGANEEMGKNLPSVGEETQNSLKSKLDSKKAEIEEKIKEIKDKEEEQKAEIEEMKRAIEEKYKKTFDLMESKKQELEMMMQQLEGQLFVLDTQIYGIRCFFGETVHFTKLVSGKNSSVETPVVLYQKIRFLDEELAKYTAIYGFDGEDTAMFEELLKHREDLRNLFFPEGKTVSLVRISRDGISYKSGQDYSISDTGNVSIYNVMKEYEVYHGEQIAILVRNGENCYIGWTETDRISVSDGNVFLTPKESGIDKEAKIEKDYAGNIINEHKATDKKEVAARYFIFSIVQGLIENSSILELPQKVSVTQNSPYIVFSMAENWLADNTYDSFDDIWNKCSKNLRKGDTILVLRNLRAEGSTTYRTYNNDRGRGYANRTHDVHARDNTLYPVNLVEDDDRENEVIYEYKAKKAGEDEWRESRFCTECNEEDYMDDFLKRHDTECYEFRNIHFIGPSKHVFISLEKDNWWTESDARANFELYRDEYWNLTFLNTVYLRYVITGRKMPNKYISSRINFSSLLPYLNTAMEYLKKREEKEEELIKTFTSLRNNWQVALTEWKLEHNVHEITEYQAKRFARWYTEKVNRK